MLIKQKQMLRLYIQYVCKYQDKRNSVSCHVWYDSQQSGKLVHSISFYPGTLGPEGALIS